MGLRFSYTLLAPLYDVLVNKPSLAMRRASLQRLALPDAGRPGPPTVLLAGIGSGLDLPHLPPGPRYLGIDLTPAMLRRARRRAPSQLDLELRTGDVMALDLPDAGFDVVIMHLILAVVPQPERALCEARRVVKPGGHILVLDKFLRPEQRAWLRRLLNPVVRRIATRIDVVFENVLAQCPELEVLENTPAEPSGWFRHILLRRREDLAATAEPGRKDHA